MSMKTSVIVSFGVSLLASIVHGWFDDWWDGFEPCVTQENWPFVAVFFFVMVRLSPRIFQWFVRLFSDLKRVARGEDPEYF